MFVANATGEAPMPLCWRLKYSVSKALRASGQRSEVRGQRSENFFENLLRVNSMQCALQKYSIIVMQFAERVTIKANCVARENPLNER